MAQVVGKCIRGQCMHAIMGVYMGYLLLISAPLIFYPQATPCQKSQNHTLIHKS